MIIIVVIIIIIILIELAVSKKMDLECT